MPRPDQNRVGAASMRPRLITAENGVEVQLGSMHRMLQ